MKGEKRILTINGEYIGEVTLKPYESGLSSGAGAVPPEYLPSLDLADIKQTGYYRASWDREPRPLSPEEESVNRALQASYRQGRQG